MLELESQCLGFQLGDIYIGTPTCADDIALIESSKDNLQIMLNIIGRYAKQHHYRIHPMKTKIKQCSTTNDQYKWYLDGNEITTKEDAIHLGIIRGGGGLWFFVSFRIFFSNDMRVKFFFFGRA